MSFNRRIVAFRSAKGRSFAGANDYMRRYYRESHMGEFLEAGAKAPAFNLKSDSGKSVKLSDFKGQPVVLYFYPKDDTPGCTREACAFRDLKSEVEKAGAVVL